MENKLSIASGNPYIRENEIFISYGKTLGNPLKLTDIIVYYRQNIDQI